jgi:uncharacterized DUF497 family protein
VATTGLFGDPLSLTIPDPAHSQVEDRFIIIGSSHRRKILVVVHMERALMSASSAPDARANGNE